MLGQQLSQNGPTSILDMGLHLGCHNRKWTSTWALNGPDILLEKTGLQWGLNWASSWARAITSKFIGLPGLIQKKATTRGPNIA